MSKATLVLESFSSHQNTSQPRIILGRFSPGLELDKSTVTAFNKLILLLLSVTVQNLYGIKALIINYIDNVEKFYI